MSNEASQILRFSFSATEYASLADTILTESQKMRIQNNAFKIVTIAKHCTAFEEVQPAENVIQKTFDRFNRSYKKPNARFSIRELRYLIYSMHKMRETQMFNAFIERLINKWSNRYINGLLYYVLSQWDSSPTGHIKKVVALLETKLSQYQGVRDRYLILKKNIHFLSNPSLLGYSLRKQDKDEDDFCSLEEVTKNYFGLSQSNLTYEYMSPVIAAYFEKDALSHLPQMRKILKLHNNSITPKRLIPAIIIHYGDRCPVDKQNQLISLAISMIGDPSIESKWAFSSATSEERYYLSTAREMLNEWVKEKFINLFFEKCVHEPQRKKFWLDHIKWVNEFKVICTETTYQILNSDKRLADLLKENENVYVLSTESHLDKAALVLSVGNYLMIEFSDIGSIYLYQQGSTLGRIIGNLSISNFNELKRPRMETIQSFSLYHAEGKLPHEKGWEKTLCQWMEQHNPL